MCIFCEQGLGGTVAAVAYILVIALASDPALSAFWYFFIAEIFLIASLVGYLILPYFVSTFAFYFVSNTLSVKPSK